MRSVYIFGPIHLFGQDYLPIYKRLMVLCTPFFDRVIGTYPDFWNSKEPPQEFYKRTVDTVTNCNLFIVETSAPSHGVGMELQMAVEHNIPVIALAKKDVSISSMVLGLPTLRAVIRYQKVEDLEKQIQTELKKFK